ncbi:MAG: PRC-barrel domain-containing protein [Burkholderiales bacterium]
MNLNTAKTLIGIALCGLALISCRTAQEQDEPPIAGKVTLGVVVEQAELIAIGWRASKLIHADVYNDCNEKIGRIDDFIVSPDGALSVAIVNVGGFLGLAVHRVAIPVQQFAEVSPKLILQGATKEVLKALPEFKYAA